jgi:F-type H+-transporting ATPase subunit b
MSFLAILLGAEGGDPIDDARSVSPIWPEQAELIYGTLASLIIFGVIWYFAKGPVKKAMADRTQGIQDELDESAAAKAEAEAEAANIRQAAGDIDAERQRLFAEADAQAEALLADGRARLEDEVAELERRADADIEAASGRAADELRSEISSLAAAATDRVLAGGILDDAAQQDLVEQYIQKVGAS